MNSEKARARLDELISLAPVVPVITIEKVADAVPMARALVRGGLRVIEITLRTNAAPEAARAILAEVPEALVGLGTVLTPDDLDRAVAIGAAFAISPGVSLELLHAASALGIAFAPGIQTPSDLIACVSRGFELVKFFPAVAAGGIAALHALSGPFPNVRYCPTGGIKEADAAQWLAQPMVAAVGGSWIAPASDVRAGAWALIEERARIAAALPRRSKS